MRLVEERIQKAMAEGAFTNLPGKGRPLHLEDNPYEDPAWRTAYRMLRNAGYSLPWIDSARDIENGVKAARRDLARAWAQGQAGDSWALAVAQFKSRIEELNRQLRDHNLEVPAPRFQIPALNFNAEYKAITGQEA